MTTNKARRKMDDQFPLRLPAGLRDRIKAVAQRNGRSMNIEVVRVLEREFPATLSIEGKASDLEPNVTNSRAASDGDVAWAWNRLVADGWAPPRAPTGAVSEIIERVGHNAN